MTGNDLIDDYLSELMDDPGKGNKKAPTRTAAEDAVAPAEPQPEAAAAEDVPGSENASDASDATAAASLTEPPAVADDSESESEKSNDDAEGANGTLESADDPLAAFRGGPNTIDESEFEAMLDALQGQPAATSTDTSTDTATAAAPTGAAATNADPLAAFREGDPMIADDEFEAMLDALQKAPAAPANQAAPTTDPLAAFRDGSAEIADDEFEAMLDALQGQPPAAAAAPAPNVTPPAVVVAEPPEPDEAFAARLPAAVLEPMMPPKQPLSSVSDSGPASVRGRRAEDRVTSWLRFNLARQCFAVEVLKVQEVLRVPSILPVRGTGEAMLGVMNLRGQIVPVMDLAIRLGFERIEPTEASRVIVLEEKGETLGLLVASVADVINLSDGRMERISGTPSLIAAEVVRGISRREGVIIIMLDATRLLA